MFQAHKKVDLITDLQYGSTGKGLLAGYLAADCSYDVIINANMPNAGHTFIDHRGNVMVHKVLPNGIVGFPKYVLLGPGSVFDPDRLQFEMDQAVRFGYDGFKILIHQNAVPLKDIHVQMESELVAKIGSTATGGMAAQMDKMARNPEDPATCRAMGISHFGAAEVIDHSDYIAILYGANHILAEGAQGYSLSLNGSFYPYVTSRDCTPTRILAEMVIPWHMLDRVIGTMRTFPIRVGGNSGPAYPDQKELTWQELGQTPERTTVTKRIRRVFELSRQQTLDSLLECGPNAIFLNFCNYLDDEDQVADIVGLIDDMAKDFLGVSRAVKWLGYGPTAADVRGVNV